MSAQLIEETAARLFADRIDRAFLERAEAGDWPADLWRLVEENGLTLALATEAAGGIGATWEETYPILRQIGYAQAPLPLMPTLVAAFVLSCAGAPVLAGPVALVESLENARLDGERLTGTAPRVAWARHCGHALVDAGDALVLVALNAPGVRLEPARANAAGEPGDAVVFSGTPLLASFANPFAGLEQPLRHLGALGMSAMLVGAMEFALEQALQYANDRVQFGRPLAKYQAIQHALADLAGQVASARMAVLVACAGAPHAGRRAAGAAPFDIAVAKVRAGEAATRAVAITHQVHGAIGFTLEHRLNYATRRLMAWRAAHGSDAWWAERLGHAAIAAGAAGFWPAMTARSFAPQ
jgi:acyl-CoA dehydrogenase